MAKALLVARQRLNGATIDARSAAIVVGTLGLLGWVGSASRPVSAGPLAFAAVLVAADALVALRRSVLAGSLMTQSVAEWRGGTVELGRPSVEVSGVRSLTATGDIRDFSLITRADGSVAAEPPEHSGRPVEDVALVVDVAAQAIGLTVVGRRLVFPSSLVSMASPASPAVSLGPATADSLRPYVAGDARNRVDWKSTARTGVLHVRSTQTADTDDFVIVVELLPEATDERHASALDDARCLASAAIRQKRSVRLVTCSVSAGSTGDLAEEELRAGRSVEDVAARLAALAPSIVDDSVADLGQLATRLARCRVGSIPPIDPGEVRCS